LEATQKELDERYEIANSLWIYYWKVSIFLDCAKGWTKVE